MIQKVNKKNGLYKVNTLYASNDFIFIIDGSNHNNENSLPLKLYIWNLKKALIKYLKYFDSVTSIKKASTFVNKNFRGKIKLPCIDITLVKKNNDKLEVVIVNNGKCYIKEKNTFLVQNERFSKELEERLNSNKSSKYLYLSLEDKSNYIYHEFWVKDVYKILLCNEPVYRFQRFLKASNNKFLEYIDHNSLKEIIEQINDLEKKGTRLTYKKQDDFTCLYKILE